MTRHTAYSVTSTGHVSRRPFASFPHAEAARIWLENHPGERVRFSPPLPDRPEPEAPALDAETFAQVQEDARAAAADAPRIGPVGEAKLRAIIHGRTVNPKRDR